MMNIIFLFSTISCNPDPSHREMVQAVPVSECNIAKNYYFINDSNMAEHEDDLNELRKKLDTPDAFAYMNYQNTTELISLIKDCTANSSYYLVGKDEFNTTYVSDLYEAIGDVVLEMKKYTPNLPDSSIFEDLVEDLEDLFIFYNRSQIISVLCPLTRSINQLQLDREQRDNILFSIRPFTAKCNMEAKIMPRTIITSGNAGGDAVDNTSSDNLTTYNTTSDSKTPNCAINYIILIILSVWLSFI